MTMTMSVTSVMYDVHDILMYAIYIQQHSTLN